MKSIPSLLILSISSSFVACSTVQKTSATSNWGKPKPMATKDTGKRRTVRTTAYSHLENEPGACGNKTALGTTLRYGSVRSAAADWSRYPVGTRFKIVGQPHIYEIDDYGSALVGTGTIDLYKPTLGQMNAWGVRHVDIQIIKWGCYDKSAQILSRRTKYAHCNTMYRNLPKGARKSRPSTNPDSAGSLFNWR